MTNILYFILMQVILFGSICAQDATIDRPIVHPSRELTLSNATDGLLDAIANNQSSLIKRYVDLGGDINVRNSKGMSLLHRACFCGYLNCARKLVQLNAEMMNDQMNQFRVTPLMVAIANERFDVAKFLLKAGAKKDLITTTNKTSLDVAILYLKRNIYELINSKKKDEIFYIIGLLVHDVHEWESEANIRIKGERAAFQYMEDKDDQEILNIFKQQGIGKSMTKSKVTREEKIGKLFFSFDEEIMNRSDEGG